MRPAALVLVEGDALDQDLPNLVPAPFRVVANLPYHITSPILHRLLGAEPRPTRMVLMVQWEVAERLAAPPGRMSYLSVFVQYHATVRIARRVPAEAFEPAPERHLGRDRPRTSRCLRPCPARAPDEDALWALVQTGFRERRKMIRNVLARQLRIGQDRVDAALAIVGITGDRRPQTLSVAEWVALRAAFDELGLAAPRRRRPSRMPMPDLPMAWPWLTMAPSPRPRDRRLAPVIRLAPAKLNLTLAVAARRADGFHALHSVMVPLTLADRLSVAPAAGAHDTLAVSGRNAGPLADNLVLRAIAETRAAVGRLVPTVAPRRPPREGHPRRGRPRRAAAATPPRRSTPPSRPGRSTRRWRRPS